jgi:hypothetical protein
LQNMPPQSLTSLAQCRVVGSIDALGWKSKALSMVYLKMRDMLVIVELARI